MAAGRMKDVNVPLILTIGAISGLLLLIIAIGAHAWYKYEYRLEQERKVYGAEYREVQTLEREQRQRLEQPRWLGDEQQWATVRIEDAMDRVVQMYAQEAGNADASE